VDTSLKYLWYQVLVLIVIFTAGCEQQDKFASMNLVDVNVHNEQDDPPVTPPTPPPPSGPVGPGSFTLTSVAAGNNRATVAWMASERATSYSVLRGNTSTAVTVIVPGCSVLTQLTCVDTTVLNGGTYFYRVQASNSTAGNFSNTVSVSLPNSPAAFALTSAMAQSNQVAVTWGVSQYATSYSLFRGTDAASITTAVAGCGNLVPPMLTCVDRNLANGATYYYRVRATNAVSSLDSNNFLSAMPMGVRVKDLQVGLDYSCALYVDGAVKCWGRGINPLSTQNVGDQPGEMGANLVAINFGGLKATQISISISPHACALLENNSIACWGNNTVGQLGTGTTFEQSSNGPLQTVDLGSPSKATSVAVGPAKACATFENGFIKCWGDLDMRGYVSNNPANRGDGPGEMGTELPFLKPALGLKAVKVAVGYDFICALYDDGSVRCWNRSRTAFMNPLTESPALLDFGPGKVMKDIDAGWSNACSIGTDNAGYCWNMGDSDLPMGPIADLGASIRVQKISTAARSTCAVLSTGATRCWGSNIFSASQLLGDQAGLLGLADNQCDVKAPNSAGEVVLGNFPAADVSAGVSHSCVLSPLGTAKCWGSNYSGALGLGDTVPRGCRPAAMGTALPVLDL